MEFNIDLNGQRSPELEQAYSLAKLLLSEDSTAIDCSPEPQDPAEAQSRLLRTLKMMRVMLEMEINPDIIGYFLLMREEFTLEQVRYFVGPIISGQQGYPYPEWMPKASRIARFDRIVAEVTGEFPPGLDPVGIAYPDLKVATPTEMSTAMMSATTVAPFASDGVQIYLWSSSLAIRYHNPFGGDAIARWDADPELQEAAQYPLFQGDKRFRCVEQDYIQLAQMIRRASVKQATIRGWTNSTRKQALEVFS